MTETGKLRERVYDLISQRKSDSEIMKSAGISKNQLAGYKASLESKLGTYSSEHGALIIPFDRMSRLRPDQVSSLVGILDSVYAEPEERPVAEEVVSKKKSVSKKKKSAKKDEPPIPRGEIKRIVGSLLKSRPNEPDYQFIHSDPRLKGVGKMVIAGYIANYNAGS